MKYTNYFRGMMIVSFFFGGFSLVSYQEGLPTLCAVLGVISFIFWYGGIMAPDSEKFTPEYLRKYKGWS